MRSWDLAITRNASVFLLYYFSTVFFILQYSLTDKPEHLPFDLDVMSVTKYPVTEFQPRYFIAESFENAKEQVR